MSQVYNRSTDELLSVFPASSLMFGYYADDRQVQTSAQLMQRDHATAVFCATV